MSSEMWTTKLPHLGRWLLPKNPQSEEIHILFKNEVETILPVHFNGALVKTFTTNV